LQPTHHTPNEPSSFPDEFSEYYTPFESILDTYSASETALTLDEVYAQDPHFFDRNPDLLRYLFIHNECYYSDNKECSNDDESTQNDVDIPTVHAIFDNFTFIDDVIVNPHDSTTYSRKSTNTPPHTSDDSDENTSHHSESSNRSYTSTPSVFSNDVSTSSHHHHHHGKSYNNTEAYSPVPSDNDIDTDYGDDNNDDDYDGGDYY